MADLTGDAGPDLLSGGAGADLLSGLGGDDTLQGGGGDDTLDAGSGADRLDGGEGDDHGVIDRRGGTADLRVFLLAPGFASSIDGAEVRGIEAFTLLAGAGADSLVGAAGRDVLQGGPGADALTGGAGADMLRGEGGPDTLMGGTGADLLEGGSDGDSLVLHDAAAASAGSTLAAMDTISGFDASAGDLLWLRGQSAAGGVLPLDGPGRFGLAGQAILPIGFAGSLPAAAAPSEGLTLPDVTGGAAFRLFWLPDQAGDAGWALLDLDRDGVLGPDDLVVRVELARPGGTLDATSFAPGSFATLGTMGADSLAADTTAETMHGFGSPDLLLGGEASDSLLGGEDADTLRGAEGFDTLRGGTGDDSLEGGDHADALDGGADADSLTGGAGADLLLGGGGRDLLEGGEGDDTLEGAGRGDGQPLPESEGADLLRGGSGADLFVLQAASDAAWSRLGNPARVLDFTPAEGDRLRIGTAGGVANAGTLLGADGVARPLVWSVGPSSPLAALEPGLRLPAQHLPGLDALQVFWLRDHAGGGWLAIDLDADGVLGSADSTTHLEHVVDLAPADFAPGSFFDFAGGVAPTGTGGDDDLRGTARAEFFHGTAGRDTIDGGGGAPNAISYAGLAGGIAYSVLAEASGYGLVSKPGFAIDLMRSVHSIAGTPAGDTLDGSLSPTEAVYALSLEGLAGDDLITGNGARSVQASYAASPAAVRVDLAAGTAEDGWGSSDTLANIRRLALISAFDDTARGSTADDTFLVGAGGSKSIDGGGGLDEYRYVGSGAVSLMLAEEIVGLFRLAPRADKPGGRDTLLGITVAVGGTGDDTLRGGTAAERFAGGPGDDSIDGGGGEDIVFYDVPPPAAGVAQRGVTLDLTAGTATDPWGGTDALANVAHGWGTQLPDDMTGRALPGTPTWLRGLGGDDTLRAPTSETRVGADYAEDPTGIRADVGAGSVLDGWGGRDILVSIAAVRGSAFNDSLLGAVGGDSLEGGRGRDTLDGAAGADSLIGGPDDDLYRVDNPGDRIEETEDGGHDRLETSVALYLPAWIEDLVLRAGAGGIYGVGNALENRIVGNEAGNLLIAGTGDDTVEGDGGRDSVFGQGGEDWLDGGGDVDWMFGGDGADSLSGGDGDDVLFGETGDDSLAGDASVDVAIGGDGKDTLTGGEGNDLLYGQDGADSLLGGVGIDYLVGGAGNDAIDGGDQPDLIYGMEGDDLIWGGVGYHGDILVGGDGNDTLDGSGPPGAGPRNLGDPDQMHGGAGDDVFVVDSPADRIFELPDGGFDVVHATITGNGFYLPPNVETLYTYGGTAFAVGNDLPNLVVGTAGANWLYGGAGDDTLQGGGGGDVFFGQAGADLLVMTHSPGWTTIADFVPGTDRLRMEGYGFADTAAVLARSRMVGAHLVIDIAPGELIVMFNLTATALAGSLDLG